ncbi:hypothetical protein ACH5RR_017885 [Cinchona calisaya]|uniref:GH18 domain-containing protein n=1 Tax=Cinchona calisaya TaxID=153742 RepID=A0ABD2ZJZ8_9GENT
MAGYLRASFLALTLALFMLPFFKSSLACPNTVTYWGQHDNAGSLKDICKTNNYEYVNIAYLKNYAGGSPTLDISYHCRDCSYIGAEIEYCQENGIKVLLSLGDPGSGTGTNASQLAQYLWNNFLGGESSDRPLGNAILDGIVFEDFNPGTVLKFDELAKELKNYSTTDKNVYLAAFPPCHEGDYNLDSVIDTGLLDYVWVKFYDDACCEYANNNAGILLNSWFRWTSRTGINLLFMGVPESEKHASSGYIPPQVLINQVLPVIKSSLKYGGVLVWHNFSSDSYTPQIKDYTCKNVENILTWLGTAI